MASDGILASRASALPELHAEPMRPAPADGRCPHATMWKASCKSRGCPVCGPRWASNQHDVLALGLDWPKRKVATIAITGPGADVLPWDEDRCRPRYGTRSHVHSGRNGCRVQERPLREWCELLPWRWKALRESARIATKRDLERLGRGDQVPWIMARVWEPQKRGVPHLHLVVPYGTLSERRAANIFRSHLANKAKGYGFGRVQGKLKAIEGQDAARYLATYLAGRDGYARARKKTTIRQNIADPRLPRSLVWLTPVVTSVSEKPRMVAMRAARGVKLGTGVTMRTLRRARHLWAVVSGFFADHPHWSGLEEAVISAIAFRRIYPERAGPPAHVEAALAWARECDRSQHRCYGGYLKRVWDDERHEFVPDQALFQRLTELAFLATGARGELAPAGT